jgi:hypothetical protein
MHDLVVSPRDIDLARGQLTDAAEHARCRADAVAAGADFADDPLLVVLDEAGEVLHDADCRRSVEILARYARTAGVHVVLRDTFPRPAVAGHVVPVGHLGCSLLIRDAVDTGVFDVERVPVGELVPLHHFGTVDDAITQILGG